MSTRLLAGAILAGLMSLATSAYVIPIAAGSTLSLNGSDSYTSTSITFSNPANIGGAPSGSFAILTTCTGCVPMTGGFTTATATPFQLYTATEGAITTTLQVSSGSFNFASGTLPDLTITGAGTLTLTGFDPTPGKLHFNNPRSDGPECHFLRDVRCRGSTGTGIARDSRRRPACLGYWP
jgi:hypothetical protein